MGDEGNGYTPEEALSAIGFGKFQGLLLVYAGLGWMSEAMEMMLLSVVGVAVQSEWGISPRDESLLSSVVFAGMLFGAYFWGVISDGYGRRKGYLGATITIAVAGFCSTFSPNYKTLLFSRCLLGFGIGGGHVFALCLLEFIPTPNRGAWSLALTSFFSCGNVLEAAFAWIIMPRLGWRWLIALSCLPSLLVLLLSVFTPESPRYLYTKGRIQEAQKILETAARINKKNLPPGYLVPEAPRPNADAENVPTLSTSLLKKSAEPRDNQQTWVLSFLALFSPQLRKTTLLLWIANFADTFSYYGVVLMTSELSNQHSICGTANFLKNMKNGNLYVDIFITTLAELPGLIICATIVDRLGRKVTMKAMCILGSLFLLPLAIQQNEIVTTALLFGARMFVSSTVNVMTTYLREVYPTSVRSTGVGIATSMGRVGGIVCPLVAVGLVRGCHQTAAIALFEGVMFLLGFCIFSLPLETGGKGLSDTIQPSNEESADN